MVVLRLVAPVGRSVGRSLKVAAPVAVEFGWVEEVEKRGKKDERRDVGTEES